MDCGCQIDDKKLRAAFCDAFNEVVSSRDAYMSRWAAMMETGSPLERLRAKQMEEITAEGSILFEVPELTQAVLQEAWLHRDGKIAFTFLSGDSVMAESS